MTLTKSGRRKRGKMRSYVSIVPHTQIEPKSLFRKPHEKIIRLPKHNYAMSTKGYGEQTRRNELPRTLQNWPK